MFETIADRLITTIISIGSLVFPFIESIEPIFTDVQFKVVGNSLYLSTTLENCYTEELDKVISSGQPVVVRFEAELFNDKVKKPVLKQEFFRSVRYNLLDKQYEVYLSEKDTRLLLQDIDRVHQNLTTLKEVKIIDSSNLKGGQQYYIRLTAALDNITFVGGESELDLMLFWNNRRPAINTSRFNSTIFIR
jgi:hypothetical protein